MRDFSDVTIVIPCLNEVENIPRLVRLLARSYRNISIIISDDGSTDGTREAVSEIKYGRLRFLDRSRREVHGLTASVIDAAMLSRTGKTVVMDADMQHPYEKVSQISRMLDRSDLVIGVRTEVRDWGMHRRILSGGITAFALAVFGARGKRTSRDMMSGFFGIRTGIFKRLIREHRSEYVGKGYKVLLEILKFIERDARIAEIDYGTFHQREGGKSKLRARHMYYTVLSIVR